MNRLAPALEWWLAALLFSASAVIGASYVRAFERSGNRTPADLHKLTERSMWFGQSEFGAAVALACGRGFVDPGYALTPGLSAFLSVQADRFSCDELPAELPPRAPNVTQRLYRYLMWSTAAVWAVRGVSWPALWPLYAVLYGATVAVCYGLFRLGMGRALSFAAAVAVAVSPQHLVQLPGLRDYAKAPFILGLILIAGCLAKRSEGQRPLVAMAALFGVTLGIGFGFRNDIVIVVPFLAGALLLWQPPRDLDAFGKRLAALCVAGLAFAIAAWPILSAYSRGSNSGHVALMGLMPLFEQPLGITGSVYEWGHAFRDEFAETLLNSYTSRVYGHTVAYLSADYDRAMIGYLLEIARNWPADVMARGLAAALKIANLPFGIGPLEGAGVPAVALALVVVSRTSVRRAVLLLAALLYLAGYPAIQFSPRHYFHLEFIGWLALGFLVESAIAAGVLLVRAWRAGSPLPQWSREETARMAGFAAAAIAVIVLPLSAARIYQQRHMRAFLREYVDAPREIVPVQAIEADGGEGSGRRTLLQMSDLWAGGDPAQDVRTQYIAATFSPASCAAVRLPVTFRYRAGQERHDFSLDAVLTLLERDRPTEVFVPVYDIEGVSRFTGIEVPRGFEACVNQVARVRDLRTMPILLNLTLTPRWDTAPLYQKLDGWEPAGPAPSLRVYALPETSTVARMTLEQSLTSSRLAWKTAVVDGDPPGPLSIAGTPRGPQWPALQFATRQRTPDDRFVVEGEVVRGGIRVGLISGDKWTGDGSVRIASAGRFAASLAPAALGAYGVLIENSLDDSWFMRHAPSGVVQFAGRFHVFNDVRIFKAGWVRRTEADDGHDQD